VVVQVVMMRAEESREEALAELLEDARVEHEAEAAAVRDAELNDAARARTAERREEATEEEPPQPSEKAARESLLENAGRRPKLQSAKEDEEKRGEKRRGGGERRRRKRRRNFFAPSNLDELYEVIAEGEKAQSEAQRRERARLYGSASELERRATAYGKLSRGERRAVDAEVTRILRAVKKGHYAVLGLRRSCRALEIKQRYRAKALLVHPDANKSPKAPEAFDALRQAHETLADPKSRADYDRKLLRATRQKRMRLRREITNLLETAEEYVRARFDQFPLPFFGAGLLTFLLIV